MGKEPLSKLISELWNQRRRKRVPVVSKQTPTHNGRQTVAVPASQDDFLGGAVPLNKLVFDQLNVVIYGENRVGKTSLATEFDKPALMLSYEPGQTGGASSVRFQDGVTFIRVTSKAQAIGIARGLRIRPESNWRLENGRWHHLEDAQGRPNFIGDVFRSHIHDTCTSLQDMLLREIMKWEEMPVQLKWGSVPDGAYQERSEQAKAVMVLFRDLPANTIFVAQQRDHNPPADRKKLTQGLTTSSFIAADLGQATVKWMHDACDFVCQLYLAEESIVIPGQRIEVQPGEFQQGEPTVTKTGRVVRRLRCISEKGDYGTSFSGFRSPSPECVPEWIDGASPKELYDNMMMVIRGERALRGHYPKRGDLVMQGNKVVGSV